MDRTGEECFSLTSYAGKLCDPLFPNMESQTPQRNLRPYRLLRPRSASERRDTRFLEKRGRIDAVALKMSCSQSCGRTTRGRTRGQALDDCLFHHRASWLIRTRKTAHYEPVAAQRKQLASRGKIRAG